MKHIGQWALLLGLLTTLFTACSSRDDGQGPAVKYYAYVTNSSLASAPQLGRVSAFAVDADTGALTAVAGSPFSTGRVPKGIAVDPSGKFAYVANQRDFTISAFAIDAATGALSTVAGSPFDIGPGPYSIAVHPSGKFAYAPYQFDLGFGDVYAFAIDVATGALAGVSGAPINSVFPPTSVAIHPSGKFAYVIAGSVYSYAIDPVTGALTTMAGSPFSAGSDPWGVAIHPTGKYAYVTNQNDISAFDIDDVTGAPTAIAGSPFAAGNRPLSIAIDPTGKFAYTANQLSKDVSAFAIDASTGGLTAVAGSPFAAGTSPTSVAIDLPAGSFTSRTAMVTARSRRSPSIPLREHWRPSPALLLQSARIRTA